MRIKPNRSVIEGRVESISPAPDGYGANVAFVVERTEPAKGFEDFLQAAPGSVITVFAAEPETVEEGKSYKLTTSVLGGPRGERVVLEKAQRKR